MDDTTTSLVRVIGATGEIDTAPPGFEPGQLLNFSDDDGRDEVGDPHRFSAEPWDEHDPEAEAPEVEEFVSFGPLVLEDVTTRARWLQSGLKALVEPRLVVDGKLGPRTRAAVRAFQRRAPDLRPGQPELDVDGVAGPQTIAALEAITGVPAPGSVSDVPDDLSIETWSIDQNNGEPAGPPLIVGERVVDGETEYVIRAGDDEVSFRYWTPEWNDYKPYNVSRYRGARRGLLTDAQILAGGYSRSELAILKANALEESAGAFGAINTWDDQIVSWGMAQFAGHAGTLAALLAELKDDPRTAPAFGRWFAANGVDVAHGPYPFKAETRTGWHVVVRAGDTTHTGDRGWEYIRTQPRLIGAFLLAGNDPAIQLGQVLFWRRAFLTRAIRKVIGKLPPAIPGAAVSRFLTAERSLAVIVRLHNWMPAYVVQWSNRFLAELAAGRPAGALHDPGAWDREPALEAAFVDKICAERKRVKRGSYDDYALDLSRARGSFVAGRDAAD